MKYNKLGNNDLIVSQIAFGAWAIGGWMWGGANEKDAVSAIEKSIDIGVTTIDTAPVYGFGKSEEIIGNAIKGKRDKVQILTKFGLKWDDNKGKLHYKTEDNNGKPTNIYRYSGKNSIINECELSLKRLRTDYIDLYQIHWPDLTTPFSETLEAIELLHKQGKIKFAGLSNFSKELIKKLPDNNIIISNQLPYSMLNRGIEKELVPYSVSNNIGIIAYSPLQRGILTGKIKPGYHFNKGDSRPDTPYYNNHNLQIVDNFLKNISPIAEKYNASLSQLVLNWTTNQSGITCVLSGARNAQQIEDNSGATNFEINKDDMELIDKEISLLQLKIT